MFKPVVWVRVGLETNGTCLFCGPHSWLSRHIFRIFVPCMGSEEIVPVSTRILRESRRNKNKKTFFLPDRAQTFFGRVSANFPNFFFVPDFVCCFCHYFLYAFLSRTIRVLSGAISSETVKDARNWKIYSESPEFGPPNRQVPFVSNPTLTHTTGLNMARVLLTKSSWIFMSFEWDCMS